MKPDIETTIYKIVGVVDPTIELMKKFDTVLGEAGFDWTDRDTGEVPLIATNYCSMGDVVVWEMPENYYD